MLDKLLLDYVKDTENPLVNWKLAQEYDGIGHTAAAVSFYLRCAERTEDKNLSYDCLMHMSDCFDRQQNRDFTVKALLREAMTLIPTRPEAYYRLSYKLESEKNYSESYQIACLGLTLAEHSGSKSAFKYPGTWGLIFQKAVAAWWIGKGMESRKLFQDLLNEHWEKMDAVHKTMTEKNIVNLGSGPYEYCFRYYNKSMYEKLRYKFSGSEKIEKNYSQVYQDLFILSVLDGKKNGSFLEIGGADPWLGNNTALLESMFDWRGVSIEYDKKFISTYKGQRPKAIVLHQDALTTDYEELLRTSFEDTVIDYLQLDIEPARNTYECMLKIPFDQYKFRVITYEHDYYADVTRSYRDLSREFLRSKGYVLVANDISPDGICNFEDWWVHPDLVDPIILSKMMDYTEGAKDATAYMFGGEKQVLEHSDEKIPTFNVNRNYSKRAFIVDNFYQDPLAIREFAKHQEYIEGGFGRGFIGKRTKDQFLFPGIKEAFESIMGKRITKWEEHGMNGRFQLNIAGEPIVYHCDDQDFAAMIYLTPDAPSSCGTSTFRHRATKIFHKTDPNIRDAFNYKTFLDATPYEKVDQFGNMFNRLIIFDAGCIHGANEYFGSDMEDARLWHMFFFDAE